MNLDQALRALGHQPDDGCDDCDADTALTEHAPGLFVLEVRHDDTCPAYRAHRRRRA